MSILIIALPRTGSSELGKNLSDKNRLKYVYEPFDAFKGIKNIDVNKNTLIKTVVFRHPVFIEEAERISWLIEFTKKFDSTILMSRRNIIECAESWAYLVHNKKEINFRGDAPYFWEKTPNYDQALTFIKNCHTDLEYISEKIDVPITYYEDIYDLNDKGRLRKGNKEEIVKKII